MLSTSSLDTAQVFKKRWCISENISTTAPQLHCKHIYGMHGQSLKSVDENCSEALETLIFIFLEEYMMQTNL